MTTDSVITLPSKSTTLKLVAELKAQGVDNEFYPTTPRIIQTVKDDIRRFHLLGHEDKINLSVLDCGAGDGRVLANLTQGAKYAIESAQPLISALPADVMIVGTDFNQQTLIDKKVDVVFSNPPYGDFFGWAYKIIREANAPVVYLVIPSRWKDNEQIQQAIEMRKAEAKVLSTFDFLDGDRQARATVDVIRVTLCHERSYHSRHKNVRVDPFSLWFEEHFSIEAQSRKHSDSDIRTTVQKSVSEQVTQSSELVKSDGLVNVLERFYQRDMAELMANYKSLSALDPVLLKELNVDVNAVRDALQLKIESRKAVYWQELFNNLETITSRLCAATRSQMLNKLQSHTHIDFSVSNAHAVALWVIKNANGYLDSQLIEFTEKMVSKANIELYKSNKRTFGNEDWRYNRAPEDLSHFKLEYRIVLDRMGGISSGWESVNGLAKYAANYIDDALVIASNLGLDTNGLCRCHNFEWESNKKQVFEYRDPASGELKVLFEVRAFINGNLHFKFAPEFMCKLNTEFGRLKGWLRSAQDACDELNITPEEAQRSFGSNIMLTANNILKLGFNKAA